MAATTFLPESLCTDRCIILHTVMYSIHPCEMTNWGVCWHVLLCDKHVNITVLFHCLVINLKRVHHSYDACVTYQRMLSRQRQHIAVRRGLREDSSDGEVTSRSSVRYVASQYLTDSSLNNDVSQFDFASSVCLYILFAASDHHVLTSLTLLCWFVN